MPAKLLIPLTGVALSAAALCGCTSTSTVASKPSFTETAAATGTDAGFQLALPDQVAVVPEPSGRETNPAVAIAVAPQAVTPAAFAGATPQKSGSAVADQAQPVVVAGEVSAVAAGKSPKPVRTASIPAGATVDPTKVFPAAPPLPQSDTTVVASIKPISYAGPVPVFLAPSRPLASTNAFADTGAPKGRGDVEKLIEKYASFYQVPVELVRHVVNRESTFNPRAYNHGHWGLMQIKHQTARGMGYDGPPAGLFDAETNLKYAVKYLRGAWMVAGRDQRRADRLYQTGYYYEAKRKGMLEATGLGVDRTRRRVREEEVRLDPEGLVRPPVLPVGSSS